MSPKPLYELPAGLDAIELGAPIRAQFPLLNGADGERIIYLDSAATSQKPQVVIDAMTTFYSTINSNVHRGVYRIAAEATDATEHARAAVARFIGATSTNEIVFTKNATESLNLVANSWGRSNLGPGDAIVLSHMEHHANIVPWQMLAAERGFEIRWIPLTPDGQLDLESLDVLLDGAKLLSISAMSNVLSTVNPVARLAEAAHAAGALICVDGCQLAPHAAVNVSTLDIDFFAFSAHKLCGPTGIGALWAKADILNAMPPFLGGGEMIRDVRLDGFTANELPWKFEAGTPPIAEIVGFGCDAQGTIRRPIRGPWTHRCQPTRGRDVVRVPRPPPARLVPDPRHSVGLRASRASLRKTPDEDPWRWRNRSGIVVLVQR